MESNLKLQSEIGELKNNVDMLINEVEKKDKALEKINDQTTCLICSTNKRNTALVPCGHIVCDMCSAQLVASKGNCWCRKPISYAVKLIGLDDDE